MKLAICLSVVSVVSLMSAEPQPAKAWLGRWEFTECWPSIGGEVQNCVVYVLDVRQKAGKTVVNLDIDGYQVMRRLRCDVATKENGIQIVFEGIREEDGGGRFQKGDVLVELSRSGSSVMTLWKKLKPALDEHLGEGVYFEKARRKK